VIEVEKGANLKISSCKVKAIVPSKRIWGEGKREKVVEDYLEVGEPCKRRCKEIYTAESSLEKFKCVNIADDDYERCTRDNNDDPSSFFTNEFCHLCGCKYFCAL
jgi:hypothetical protein